MYDIPDLSDPPVTCPYDSNHVVCRSRIQKHIVKCEKNYPVGYKVLCPYNGSHRVFEYELKDHAANCPARKVFEPEISEEAKTYNFLNEKLHLSVGSTSNYTEDWDADDNMSVLSLHSATLKSAKKSALSESEKKINIEGPIRPPRGYSEAMMRDTDEEIPFEDTESIVSSMAIGRGRSTVEFQRMLGKIGKGRGAPLNKDI